MYEMSMQIIVGPFPAPVYSSSIKCALKQTVVKCFTELCCLKDDKSLITVGDSRRETRIGQLPINMMYLMYYISVLWRGTGGREPGRTGGGRGTGDGRRKDGKRDLYDGGKRERKSKRQAFFNCYCSSSSQRNKPNNVY